MTQRPSHRITQRTLRRLLTLATFLTATLALVQPLPHFDPSIPLSNTWARRAGRDAPDLLPEYEASVGSILKFLRGLGGSSEGDPRKIADVIVQLANIDEVPLRLILGVDAEKRVH